MQPVEIVTRPYDPSIDNPYIYSTWTKRAWYSPVEPIKIPKKQWFTEKIRDIRRILSPETVRIACFKDTPYAIGGYIVVLNGQVIWMCIKKDYRNQGVEELLHQSMKEKIYVQEGN